LAREAILHDCVVFLLRVTSPLNSILVANAYRPRWVLVRFCCAHRVCHMGVGFAGSFASLHVSGYLLRSDNGIARCKTFHPSPLFFFLFLAYTFKSEVVNAAGKANEEISCHIRTYLLDKILLIVTKWYSTSLHIYFIYIFILYTYLF